MIQVKRIINNLKVCRGRYEFKLLEKLDPEQVNQLLFMQSLLSF